MFPSKPYSDMDIPYRVHRGFLAAWEEVKAIILKKIQEIDEPYLKCYRWKHIVIIGYSHGGALSGLCHEFCWFHRPDLREEGLEGYGFESPRFYAGYSVKDELKERWKHYTVIRCNNDIVTHCPPWIFGYCHVGSMLKVQGDTSLVQEKHLKCIKSHFPQVVYDGLIKYENQETLDKATKRKKNKRCFLSGK